MASLTEHVAAVQAALQAAKEDGYKPDFWFNYDEQGDVEEVVCHMIRLQHKDGWMQVAERERLATWGV